MTRRNFIGAAAAFGAFPRVLSGARTPSLRFGVVSDVHLDYSPVRTEAFRRVLEGFRAEHVDAVLIPGDIAHYGEIKQLRLARAVWDEVFPNSKLPDGSQVTRLFLPGNHDWNFPKNSPSGKYLAEDMAKTWKAALGDEFEPVRKVTVKGVPFVLVDWFAVKDVDQWFEAHASELDPNQPLIYAQHPHPKGTCYDQSLAYWGGDGGASTKALSRFPKAIAFSGHSHYPVSDPYSIWQGAFTSINCGSTACAGRDYVPTDESLNGPAYDYKRMPELMPRVPVWDESAAGLVVTLSDGQATVTRRDYLYDLPLGETWQFPLAGERPYALKTRKDNRQAPQFDATAALSVTRVWNRFKLKVRSDDRKPGDETLDVEQLRIKFPPAHPVGDSRVFGYEVSCREGDKLRFARFVLARDFHLPMAMPPRPQEFYVDLSEFSDLSKLSFEVRPLSRFGAKGRPLARNYVAR